jgi:DNA-binding response OmpR family regulator
MPSHFERILVIDDDPNIRAMVTQKLSNAGYETLAAASAQEALDMIDRHGLPHVAIVDLMMPGMDGFEFCERVQQYSDLPIILLTAVDEEESVIRGLRDFAEDYVTKPFSPRELVVRVERVLRRIRDFGYTAGRTVVVDDRLSVDFVHQRVIIAGAEVHLTPTETRLLYILMRNAGQILTTDFLLQRLWPLDEVYEDTLRVHSRSSTGSSAPTLPSRRMPTAPAWVCSL